MTGEMTRLRVVAAGAALALAAALSACDSGSAPAQGQDTSAQSGSGGGLLSVAQAELAARQWWSQNEQALVRRDGPLLGQLDATPLSDVVGHAASVSAAIGRPLLASPRQPSAVRVYVPAEQSFPLHVLAVFDVATTGKTATFDRVAEMFVQRSASAPFVA